MEDPDLIRSEQATRLQDAKRRAYQTRLIMTRRTTAYRLMANWLTFSGIAVPVIGGGIVFAVYANEKPPEWLFDVTGLLATAQVLVTVFSLVAGWDRKRAISEVARNDFTRLRIALDNLRPDGNGIYDQEVLGRLVTQSYRGSSVDDELEVSEQEKQTAERRALERYPVR